MNVELVSKTVGVGKYKNLSSEELVSAIARHGVIKEDNGKLVKYLMDSKHASPLDMVNFTFEIQTSRAIGRQILRHASIKFQEHSQRYSDKVVFEPIELRMEHPTNRQSSTEVFDPKVNFGGELGAKASAEIEDVLNTIKSLYRGLIDSGVAKECARMILPETTQSTLSANGTLRSWLSFLNVRLDHHAQKEVQNIAKLIGEALAKDMPNVFSNIDWKNGMFL
jgi:thymidylate synthase (FAD)